METPTLVSGATPPWVTYTTTVWAVAVALLVILLRRRLRRPKLNSPPGPKPWPIIGNLNLIDPLPHHSLHSLSQIYGPLMELKFGSFPVIVGSSVEVARAILQTHDATFSGRPKTAAGKYTTYNYSDIIWSPYGPYWRQARKMCLTELFSAQRLESYEYIRVEELRNLLKAVYDASGEAINLKDNLTDVSLNGISRMVLGKKYTVRNGNEKEIVTPEEFKEMLDEFFLLNGVLEIGDSIPWVSFLDLQGYIKRMKAVAKKFDRFMEHVLDEHNAKRKSDQNWSPKDMVDILLELADNPDNDVKLERHGVKAFSQDMIAGGTESSAVTVEWALSEMLRKPEIFDRATEELDRVIGRERWVEEKDMVNLPYICAVAKEAMRLHPVAPMLVPREAREDVQVDGYDIKKGSRVLVNVWAIARDPKVWDKPYEFLPERFLNSSIDVKGHDFELLPFGAGRRMCPGYPLGIKVVQATLSNLLHGFKWKLPSGMNEEELSMEEIFGLTTPKRYPLIAVAVPRLAPHVYPK